MEHDCFFPDDVFPSSLGAGSQSISEGLVQGGTVRGEVAGGHSRVSGTTAPELPDPLPRPRGTTLSVLAEVSCPSQQGMNAAHFPPSKG